MINELYFKNLYLEDLADNGFVLNQDDGIYRIGVICVNSWNGFINYQINCEINQCEVDLALLYEFFHECNYWIEERN